jgi:hypothetical protein
MQRVPDYQVIVDASGNTSSRLLMDTTPDISLRQFLESLDLDFSGVFGTINLLGGVYSVIPTTPIDLPDLVTGVTVDGVEGLPDGGTGAVDIVLDSVREVEILSPSGAGTAALVARAVAGTGKKLQITFPQTPDVGATLGTPSAIVSFNEANTKDDTAFRELDGTVVSDPIGAWDPSVDQRFSLPPGYDYLLFYNVRIQQTASTAGMTGDNLDTIFAITRDESGVPSSLGGRTSFLMDRRENQDTSACATFSGIVPISAVSTTSLRFWAYGDGGAGTVAQFTTTGQVWLYRIPDGSFNV